MALIPRQVVPAPEPRGLRYGLLTAATGPLDLPSPHGRGGGVTYDPVSCGFARLYPVECDGTPPEKEFDPADGYVNADPFVAYATYICGSVGSTQAELETKVQRRLANGEQSVAEQALWTLMEADTDAVDATPTDTGSLVDVVSALEDWLYGDGGAAYGNIGFLHASPGAAAHAMADQLLVRDGAIWRTAMGTIWVFGGGYGAGTVRISGNVTVWRSPDVLTPPAAQVFDRSNNEYRLLAEREYAVAYDCVTAFSTYTEAPSS